MKKLLSLALLLVCAACQKRNAKHCPLMEEARTGHSVDITRLSPIPQVLDTVNKYPQLQAVNLNFVRGVNDPSLVGGNVTCNVFYKDLLIFDKVYNLSYFGHDQSLIEGGLKPARFTAIQVGTVPSISMKKASEIALKTLEYEHCTTSRLGLFNRGSDSIPDYRLTWRVRSVEYGYPLVDVDALDGTVLNKIEITDPRLMKQ